MRRKRSSCRVRGGTFLHTSRTTRPTLTAREIEVLTGMSNGRSNAQIGADLFLSEDTVKTHMRHIMGKLAANDRTHAVTIARKRGMLPAG